MPRSANTSAIWPALSLFAATALGIGLVWWWLGTPIRLPPSPLAQGEKLYCVSYAPYRGSQDPLVEGTRVDPKQIDEDLALLSKYSNCVRTYSVDDGIETVLASARRYGLKVLDGLWLSGDREKNRRQIDTTVELAKQYSDVISAVVVGNEVLLRGDLPVNDLISAIREIKAKVPEPVTYADVWEFWLRYPETASAVDFVTVHILPYWEDFPIAADQAAAHVEEIRARVAAAFPNKDILIGEFGWPGAGRMREGARPSPSNQARVIEQTLALAKREHFRVNIIEAFDQPWKRWLEGTVGGKWGIFDRAAGRPKFNLGGGAVSDHPRWRIQALAGILLAAVMFCGAFMWADEKPTTRLLWWKIAALAFLPAIMFGWTIEQVAAESFSVGGWLRSLALAGLAAMAPIACAVACAAGRPVPALAHLLGGRNERRDALGLMLAAISLALVLLSFQAALGLVFDPRYRDIPFAPLAAAIFPFAALSLWTARPAGMAAMAERVAAVVLAAATLYVIFNEGFANWQAIWFGADLLCLAFILGRARDAPD